MAVDDLSDLYSELRQLRKDVTRLMASTMLQDSSITRGRLRIASEEGLLVEGSARVSGRFFGEGTFEWTGPESHTGNETHDGTITISGDMNVIDEGNVNVGTAMTLTPATDGGAVVFDNGATVSGAAGGVALLGDGDVDGPSVVASSDGAQVRSGTGAAVTATSLGVIVEGGGPQRLTITQSAVKVSGLVKAPAGTTTYPVLIDGSGNLYHG